MSEQLDLIEAIVNHHTISTKDLVNTLLMYLAGFSPNGTEQAYETYTICKPAMARIFAEDLGAFSLISRKIKEKLGISLHIITDDIERLVPKEKDIDKAQKPARPKYLARFPGLVDICEDQDGKLVYLVKVGDELRTLERWEHDGVVYVPPKREQLPWLIPRLDRVLAAYENDDPVRLFANLIDWHHSISDLPSDEHYALLAAWDLHATILEMFDYSPILCLFAVPERGKTRTGEGIVYVAPRGMHTESLREANLFRDSEDRGAVLFLDVKDLWRKAERAGSEDVLLQRYEKGARVERVLYPDKGKFEDTVFFDVFGATILATNEPLHHILDTRCIPIVMPEARRQFALKPDRQQGLELRERILGWRARQLDQALPQVDKPAQGRLGDITKPLLQVVLAVAPQHREALMKVIHRVQQDRLMEKSASLEAGLIQVLIDLEKEVDKGAVPLKRVVGIFNEGKPEKWHITPERAGRRLRALGLSLRRGGSRGERVVDFNSTLLTTLSIQYGLSDPQHTPDKPSDPSDPAEPSVKPGIFDTDGSDRLAELPQTVSKKSQTKTTGFDGTDGTDGMQGAYAGAEKNIDPWEGVSDEDIPF